MSWSSWSLADYVGLRKSLDAPRKPFVLLRQGAEIPDNESAFRDSLDDPGVGFVYRGAITVSGVQVEAVQPTPELLWRDCPTIGVVGFRTAALACLPRRFLDVESVGDVWLLLRQLALAGWRWSVIEGQDQLLESPLIPGGSYYDFARLAQEPVTVFCPLSGREELWSRFSGLLEQLQWHSPVKIQLLDTSYSSWPRFRFSDTVQAWLGKCPHDVSYSRLAVGSPGLADSDRTKQDNIAQTQLAMARIWNHLRGSLTTPWVLTLEDDVFPKDSNVIERLMRGFSPHVDSVSAAYQSATGSDYVAWDYVKKGFKFRSVAGSKLENIGGNGFGCCLLRAAALKQHVFQPEAGPGVRFPDCDLDFYDQLARRGRGARLDWRVQCEHVSRKRP